MPSKETILLGLGAISLVGGGALAAELLNPHLTAKDIEATAQAYLKNRGVITTYTPTATEISTSTATPTPDLLQTIVALKTQIAITKLPEASNTPELTSTPKPTETKVPPTEVPTLVPSPTLEPTGIPETTAPVEASLPGDAVISQEGGVNNLRQPGLTEMQIAWGVVADLKRQSEQPSPDDFTQYAFFNAIKRDGSGNILTFWDTDPQKQPGMALSKENLSNTADPYELFTSRKGELVVKILRLNRESLPTLVLVNKGSEKGMGEYAEAVAYVVTKYDLKDATWADFAKDGTYAKKYAWELQEKYQAIKRQTQVSEIPTDAKTAKDLAEERVVALPDFVGNQQYVSCDVFALNADTRVQQILNVRQVTKDANLKNPEAFRRVPVQQQALIQAAIIDLKHNKDIVAWSFTTRNDKNIDGNESQDPLISGKEQEFICGTGRAAVTQVPVILGTPGNPGNPEFTPTPQVTPTRPGEPSPTPAQVNSPGSAPTIVNTPVGNPTAQPTVIPIEGSVKSAPTVPPVAPTSGFGN